jgi:hypothetical protein
MTDEEDAFDEFKNGSAQHMAIVTSVGTLIISVKIGGDRQALTDFQLVAERALKIGAENNRDVEARVGPVQQSRQRTLLSNNRSPLSNSRPAAPRRERSCRHRTTQKA